MSIPDIDENTLDQLTPAELTLYWKRQAKAARKEHERLEREVGKLREAEKTVMLDRLASDLFEARFDAEAARRMPGCDMTRLRSHLDRSTLVDEEGRPDLEALSALFDIIDGRRGDAA